MAAKRLSSDPALRAAARGADFELHCETAEKLVKLLDEHVRPGTMLLPTTASSARGRVVVRIWLPTRRSVDVPGTLTEIPTPRQPVLRMRFDRLTLADENLIAEALNARSTSGLRSRGPGSETPAAPTRTTKPPHRS